MKKNLPSIASYSYSIQFLHQLITELFIKVICTSVKKFIESEKITKLNITASSRGLNVSVMDVGRELCILLLTVE